MDSQAKFLSKLEEISLLEMENTYILGWNVSKPAEMECTIIYNFPMTILYWLF